MIWQKLDSLGYICVAENIVYLQPFYVVGPGSCWIRWNNAK